jgi:hypothetical protein
MIPGIIAFLVTCGNLVTVLAGQQFSVKKDTLSGQGFRQNMKLSFRKANSK